MMKTFSKTLTPALVLSALFSAPSPGLAAKVPAYSGEWEITFSNETYGHYTIYISPDYLPEYPGSELTGRGEDGEILWGSFKGNLVCMYDRDSYTNTANAGETIQIINSYCFDYKKRKNSPLINVYTKIQTAPTVGDMTTKTFNGTITRLGSYQD